MAPTRIKSRLRPAPGPSPYHQHLSLLRTSAVDMTDPYCLLIDVR
jgi:hypothetical protein